MRCGHRVGATPVAAVDSPVSDQHFAPFQATYNSPDDVDVRTSRLNKRGYSGLAATATVAAGVTLIMTGIRAYVRRGLATNANALFHGSLVQDTIGLATAYAFSMVASVSRAIKMPPIFT
jgi:hypothetical protein